MVSIAVAPPYPDELLEGVLGRVGLVNGFPDQKRTIMGLRVSLDLLPSASVLDVTAACFGKASRDIAYRHTLAPIQRLFSAGIEHDDEREKAPTRGALLSTRRTKSNARACPACAQRDQKTGAPSYWRRAHHLPNVDWCPEHRIPLCRLQETDFERRPSDVIGHTASPGATVKCIRPGSALDRYSLLLTRWLDRDTTLSCVALNRVVQEGCAQYGLRCAQVGKRPLVSDLAKKALPAEWLQCYWPEVLTKEPNAYLARLDGPSKDRHVPYPGSTCALVLALLFDSVDVIESRLDSVQAEMMAARRRDHGSALLAAQRDFVAGKTIGQACTAHGIAVEQFELWLRATATMWASTDRQPVAAA
ncbi:MAG: TniQ family protein [Pseudorhodoferax sp.]